MPRKQIKVEKWKKYRKREVLVKSWPSIVQAFKAEGVGYVTLRHAIETKTPLNGYYYRCEEHRPKPKVKPKIRAEPAKGGQAPTFSVKQFEKDMKKYLPPW